jgi:hypothetical protein
MYFVDVVVVFIGFLSFPDAPMDTLNLLGICIGFLGSILYALLKVYPYWSLYDRDAFLCLFRTTKMSSTASYETVSPQELEPLQSLTVTTETNETLLSHSCSSNNSLSTSSPKRRTSTSPGCSPVMLPITNSNS